MSNDQADAHIYSLGWLLRRKIPVQTMRRVLSGDSGALASNCMPVRKETDMIHDKICFQMIDQTAVNECRKLIMLSRFPITLTTPSENVLEIEFDSSSDASQAMEIYRCLTSIGDWQVVGPRCLGTGLLDSPTHKYKDHHMEFVTAGRSMTHGSWRCFLPGCMQTLDYSNTPYMTFRDLRALVLQGSKPIWNRANPEEDSRDIRFELQKKVQYLEKETKNLSGVISSYEQYHHKYQIDIEHQNFLQKRVQFLETELERSKNDAKKLFGELRQDHDRLSTKLAIAYRQIANLNDLSKSADALFRFLASIDFQDHAVSDQRKLLELMSNIKVELKKTGIGSLD